jgi:hypothetical protein
MPFAPRRVCEYVTTGRLYWQRAIVAAQSGGHRANFLTGAVTVSQAVVAEILSRVLREPEFGARLKADPERLLADLDLTEAERAAIVAGLRSSGGGAVLDPRPRIASRIV